MGKNIDIAVVVNSSRHYYRRIVVGIGRYARQAEGWSVYLEDEPAVRMPDLRSWHGRGMIADLDEPEVARAAAELDIPVVGLGGYAEPKLVQPQVPFVTSNNDRFGRLGAEHLMACGIEHFAFFGMPRHRYNTWSQRRGEAFAERLAESGHTCQIHTGRHRTPRRWDAFQQGIQDWLQRVDHPIGIMACNDDRARYLLEACRRMGLRVPYDVAVLGVDNDPLKCEMCNPPLSSIPHDAEKIGYLAAATLDRMIRGEADVPRWTAVEPLGLVIRTSTDFVAVSDPLVSRAIEFIYRRGTEPIQVTDVVKHVGVSRATLDKHARRVLGRTIHDEIKRVRLNTAKRLLRSTDEPIRDIAERSGYANEMYLSSVFRRETGMTPGRYRLQSKHAD